MAAADARRRVLVVAADKIGLIGKRSGQKGADCLIRAACRSRIEPDPGLLQRKARTRTDAAADERVDGIRLQKSRQRAVAVSHRVHNSRRDDPPVGQIVKLELRGTAKMPVNFAMVKRNCKPHKTASCSAHAVQYDDIV